MATAGDVVQLRRAEKCDLHGCGKKARSYLVSVRPTPAGGEDVMLVVTCKEHEEAAVAHAVADGYVEGTRSEIAGLAFTLAWIESEWTTAHVRRGIA